MTNARKEVTVSIHADHQSICGLDVFDSACKYITDFVIKAFRARERGSVTQYKLEILTPGLATKAHFDTRSRQNWPDPLRNTPELPANTYGVLIASLSGAAQIVPFDRDTVLSFEPNCWYVPADR